MLSLRRAREKPRSPPVFALGSKTEPEFFGKRSRVGGWLMISAVSISSGGMAAATQRFTQAAEGVATIGTSLPAAAQVDLSTTALQLIQAKTDVSLNAAMMRSSLDMEKRVLDILA